MDLSALASSFVGFVIALIIGYLAWLEWRKATLTEKVAIVERVVLAVEQMYPTDDGSDKLRLVIDRLEHLFPSTDSMELRELVEATVAKINLARQGQSGAIGRSYWTN